MSRIRLNVSHQKSVHLEFFPPPPPPFLPAVHVSRATACRQRLTLVLQTGERRSVYIYDIVHLPDDEGGVYVVLVLPAKGGGESPDEVWGAPQWGDVPPAAGPFLSLAVILHTHCNQWDSILLLEIIIFLFSSIFL